MVMNNKIKLIFFGSGDFPIKTLKSLIEKPSTPSLEMEIVGIVTSNDKNFFEQESVRDIAVNNNIPYIIPKDVNDDELYNWLKEKNADIYCVISYKFLPERIVCLPNILSFNIHASLLPFLRGSAPIHWAIRNGFKETGLTSFALNSVIDAGPILANYKCKIDDNETYYSLHEKLSEKCVFLTYDTIYKISFGCCNVIQQMSQNFDNILLKAPKIHKNNCSCAIIQNNLSEVDRTIRSLYPIYGFPAILSIYNSKTKKIKECPIKIYKTSYSNIKPSNILINSERTDDGFLQNNVITDGKLYMMIEFDNGYLNIEEIQKEGKKKMNISEFLCGFLDGRDKNNLLNIVTNKNYIK